MRLLHITLGALIVALAATSVLAGAYFLRSYEGGGLPIVVVFADAGGLGVDDSVMYGDRIVGRVESVSAGEVSARIAADHAGFVREGSRFWIQRNLGSAFLCFDSPPDAGMPASPGRRFAGLAERPDPHPSMLPPPVPRRLEARPAWLCDVRAVISVPEGENLVRDVPRRGAGAIVAASADRLLVLAPAWLIEQPEKLSERIRVELAGGELRTAQLVTQSGALCLLAVQGSAWQGAVATPWPDALADGQGLMLADFEGNAWAARLREGALEFRGGLDDAHVALVDGLNLAGFALPGVGETRGARWTPLDGVAALIDSAGPK